jgi:Zn-dependent protease with chaperone function
VNLSRKSLYLVFTLLILSCASSGLRAQQHAHSKVAGVKSSASSSAATTRHSRESDYTRSLRETAMLSLQIARGGLARAVLTMPGKLDDQSPVHQALSQSFSFPLTIVPPRKNPYEEDDDDEADSPKLDWTLIEAENNSAFTQQLMNQTAQMHVAHLAEELKSRGIKNLRITVLFLDRMPNVRVSGAEKKGFLAFNYYEADISTENPGAAVIELSWGYTRSDVWKQWPPIAGFILVPMLLTIWMGRRVLKIKDRPAEMWGRYFRYLARVMNSLWLVWLPIYAWVNLNELIPAAFGPNHNSLSRVVAIAVWIGVPLPVMWLCHLLSGQVYRNVRGAEWSPADVVRRMLLGATIGFLPLFFVILIVSNWKAGSRYTGSLIILAAASTTFLARLLRKSLRSSQYSVTRGELRDRIFELARRAGVKLKQIYVLPEGSAQLSNAFARSDNAVILTGSLLRHLSKREVDAIMGHEIGHLKERHPHRKGIITLVTLVVANFIAGALSSMIDMHRWMPAMFSFVIAGSTVFLHFLSRGKERHADAIGINLTGDPEAFISGLAKISRLNLMPMHEGGAVEFGTHPKTLGRLQDIARMHGISPERFQALLAGLLGEEEHYPDNQVNESRAKIFSTEFKQKQSSRVGLVIMGAVLLSPVLTALLLARLPLHGAVQFAAYLGGAVATFLLYQVLRNLIMSWGFGSIERRLREKIGQLGFPQAAREGMFVGLGPAAHSRRYEKCIIWDVGLLWFVDERMFYLGEEAWFVLNRSQVADTRPGLVEPAFVPRNLLYVDWRDEALGSGSTFYLTAASARSILQSRRAIGALDERINAWIKGTEPGGTAESTPNLRSPSFGEITSEPAKTRLDPMLIVKSTFVFLIIGSILSFALGVSFWSACYAIGVVIMLGVVDELPKLFFGGLMRRERQQPPPYQRGSWAESGAATNAQR